MHSCFILNSYGMAQLACRGDAVILDRDDLRLPSSTAPTRGCRRPSAFDPADGNLFSLL